MISFNSYVVLTESLDDSEKLDHEQNIQNKLFGTNDYTPFQNATLKEAVEEHPTNAKSLVFKHDEHKSGPAGLVVPKHMWKGTAGLKPGEANSMGKISVKGSKPVMGMEERNKARGDVYGHEHRKPLTRGQIHSLHTKTLSGHFKLPESEQIKREKEAVARLKASKHLDSGTTLDKGEKTDTVKHEYDEHGRSFEAMSSKGVAGHALYTSGSGANTKHHIINTCPGQTKGCGGGVDCDNIADTSKGTCFAPNAEKQYPHAAIRRAAQTQAKHDPAMSEDWILAHTHSLRKAAEKADKKNKRFLFRPNVVDETDTTSRHAIKHLNKQRAEKGKPSIIGNSYGKTDELHDPENGYHVTHSNIGPKVKHGQEISENIGRDKNRVRQSILATDVNGNDIRNDEGNKTPPKHSYLVTNMKRGSDTDKKFQKHVSHTKYWSTGREQHELTAKEKEEGHEGHFDEHGNLTTPDKAHYGHTTVNGRRYDYQKQHVLHPRMVNVDGHDIPSDSRFKDDEHLPQKRFMTKNGKKAGAVLVTTPTTSTSDVNHHSSFTHHVDDDVIEHAKRNNGEYEIDNPHEQEKAKGKEYIAPKGFPTKK